MVSLYLCHPPVMKHLEMVWYFLGGCQMNGISTSTRGPFFVSCCKFPACICLHNISTKRNGVLQKSPSSIPKYLRKMLRNNGKKKLLLIVRFVADSIFSTSRSSRFPAESHPEVKLPPTSREAIQGIRMFGLAVQEKWFGEFKGS